MSEREIITFNVRAINSYHARKLAETEFAEIEGAHEQKIVGMDVTKAYLGSSSRWSGDWLVYVEFKERNADDYRASTVE